MNISNFNPIKPTSKAGYNKHGKHKTKTVVKVLSGSDSGLVIPCDSPSDAPEIACYLADTMGVCTAIKQPIYG
jgi:hypothetical protein